MKITLCNYVATRIPQARVIHSTWRNLDKLGIDEALKTYEWIDRNAPGQFILIVTGDHIIPSCATPETDPDHLHDRCHTYDDIIRHLLLPTKIWEANANRYLEADRQWRRQHNRCTLQERTEQIHEQLQAQTA